MADGEHAAAAATTTTTTTTGDNNPPSEAEQGPLVSVTFQRNPAHKQKYLEAQPKALGITQIGLSVYQVTWLCAILSSPSQRERSMTDIGTPFITASGVVVVAGILTIAARSLHIPTLRACLVLQIFAIIASVFNLIQVMVQIESTMNICWYDWHHDNGTSSNSHVTCRQLEHAYSHYYVGGTLIQAALVAISVTVAAYCCKVVNCCAPPSKMPVITVRAPPAPELRPDTVED